MGSNRAVRFVNDGSQIASIARRGVARILDDSLLAIPIAIAVLVPNELVGFPLFALGLLGVAVQEIAGTAVKGQSFGKWMARIRVVRKRDGSLPGWEISFVRWFIHISPRVLIVLSYAWAFRNRDRQTIHDLAAGTVVVA